MYKEGQFIAGTEARQPGLEMGSRGTHRAARILLRRGKRTPP